MKHIVWAVMAAAFIFTATAGYSRGFSVGVFGAYSIDGGNIEDSIDEKRNMDYYYYGATGLNITKSEYDTVIIQGAGTFAMYQFSNGLFIRAGAEYYKLVSGGDISKSVWDIYSNNMTNYDYTIDYEAIAWPLLFGISISPDKGRTSIYIAAGVVTSLIKIYRQTELSMSVFNRYTSDNDTIISGFAGIIGAEKRIISNISILLEYTFYRCEENRKESGNQINSFPYEYQYTETYGLPRQQARFGVKYQF